LIRHLEGLIAFSRRPRPSAAPPNTVACVRQQLSAAQPSSSDDDAYEEGSIADRQFEIEFVDSGVEAFAFTFG
jgi:hypothetical protein